MDEEVKTPGTPEVILEQTPASSIVKEAEKSLEKAKALNEQTETNQILLLAELVTRLEEAIDRVEILAEVIEQKAETLGEVTTEVIEEATKETEEETTEEAPKVLGAEAGAEVLGKKVKARGWLI